MRRQAHRVAWLTATLLTKHEVTLAAYRAKFSAPPRTYYRDLVVLKQVGIGFRSRRDHGGRVVLVGLSI